MMCLVLSVMAFAQTGVDFQHLTFDEALAKAKAEKKLVFVDCYTTWCGPCKMIGPIFEEVAGELTNAKFTKVNVDECPNLAGKYRVASIPTIMVFKNGEPVDTLVGFMPKNQLKDAVEKHL